MFIYIVTWTWDVGFVSRCLSPFVQVPTLPLSALVGEGGVVRAVDVVVLRRYALQYMETLHSGRIPKLPVASLDSAPKMLAFF